MKKAYVKQNTYVDARHYFAGEQDVPEGDFDRLKAKGYAEEIKVPAPPSKDENKK